VGNQAIEKSALPMNLPVANREHKNQEAASFGEKVFCSFEEL